MGGVRATGDRDDMLGPSWVRIDGSASSGISPPADHSPHTNHTRIARASGGAKGRHPGVVCAVLEENGADARGIELGQSMCLGHDVAVRPIWVVRPDCHASLGEGVVATLARIQGQGLELLAREPRRVEQDQPCGSNADLGQVGGNHRTPRVPYDDGSPRAGA
jgi:hypothetical protein